MLTTLLSCYRQFDRERMQMIIVATIINFFSNLFNLQLNLYKLPPWPSLYQLYHKI